MSAYGHRELNEENIGIDGQSTMTMSADGESNCARFYQRVVNCFRESQELDVFQDCRTRVLDFRECAGQHKQSTWIFRESVVTMRKRDELREWLKNYDESFGNPPLLEAVDKVRKELQPLGGPLAVHPTHFKDPDPF